VVLTEDSNDIAGPAPTGGDEANSDDGDDDGAADAAQPYDDYDRAEYWDDSARYKMSERGIRPYVHPRWTANRGSVTRIVGRRGTGVGRLFRDLVRSSPVTWDCVAAMTPTPEFYYMLRRMMPASCVHAKFDGRTVDSIIDALYRLQYHGVQVRTLPVLHDCFFSREALESPCVRALSSRSNHLGIDVYIVTQYVPEVPHVLRAYTDRVFALREHHREYRMRLYKTFFGTFDTYEDFSAAHDACTRQHGTCLVIDERSGDLSWHRPSGAGDDTEITLGSRDQWLLHHMLFEPRPVAALSLRGLDIPALARADEDD
jgi:hypothetical protein